MGRQKPPKKSRSPDRIYGLYTFVSATGQVEMRPGPSGLTLQEAYEMAYQYTTAPYGSREWSPWGWYIRAVPQGEAGDRKIASKRRLTTGICCRTGRLIPFGTKCSCGCRRWNRRYKRTKDGKIKDIRLCRR